MFSRKKEKDKHCIYQYLESDLYTYSYAYNIYTIYEAHRIMSTTGKGKEYRFPCMSKLEVNQCPCIDGANILAT